MKSFFTTDLRSGDEVVNEPFLVQDVVRRKTKDDRPFLLGTLRDRTGLISFVYWDVPGHIDAWIRAGVVALVTGRATNYKDALQISITDLNTMTAPDMADFLPSSQRSRDDMIAELEAVVASLADPWRQLVTHILLDEAFLPQFATAPAARGMHHAYIGGLLEHTLSMAQLSLHLASHYPYVDKDLLLSGTLLHDMGKAMEYSLADGFSFSDDGRLVGHIIRGITLIEEAARELGDFPEAALRDLVHLVASHHGNHEWGSPVIPRTLEAVLLHQVDLLDSRVQGYLDHVRNDEGGELWTAKSSLMFNTELRRPSGM